MDSLKKFDEKFLIDGYRCIIGVDEAGRGPLAGPVVAAAVSLKQNDFSVRIQDSKKMTERQRDKAFVEIFEKAHVGVGVMNETVIDEFNILQSTFLAMNAAVRQLVFRLKQSGFDARQEAGKVCLLIDGNRFETDLPYDFQPVIGGDNHSLSIASASVVAKVTRDRILAKYHQIFPHYGFDRHKGYPTKAHREALEKHGAAFIHRKTFRTVRDTCSL